MANISADIAAILAAVYGEEVRGSIVGALNAMNDQLDDAIDRQVLTIDSTLSNNGQAANAKVTGDSLKKRLALDYSDLTAVENVTNLDSFASAACYAINYEQAQTFENMPVRLPGRLYIFSRGGTSANADGGVQLFMSSQDSGKAKVYIRGWKTTSGSTTWGSWSGNIAGAGNVDEIISNALLSLSNGMEEAIGASILGFISGLYYYTPTVGTEGGQPNESANYSGVSCPCAPGDKFTVKLYGVSGGTRAWAFLDSNNLVLSRATTYNQVITDVLTAPANAARAVFNNNIIQNPSGYAIKGESILSILDGKQDVLTFDLDPTENSDNPVTSGGVYGAINDINTVIGDITSENEETVTFTSVSNSYWNSEGSTAVITEYTYRRSEPITVTAGERYRAHIYQATSAKQNAILLTDDNYVIKQRVVSVPEGWKDITFTIPTGATKMLLTTNGSHSLINTVFKKVQSADNTIASKLDVLSNRITTLESGTFDYEGKTVAIIGDSISTNGDYNHATNPLGNVPEIVITESDIGVPLSAYVTYYDVGTVVGGHTIVESEVGTEITFTPTSSDVNKYVGVPLNNNAASVVTWWEVAKAELGFNAIPVCWSGSSITSHEENRVNSGGHYVYKCSHAWHESQIRKCGIRTPGGRSEAQYRTAPDMIIIYRGTNDLSHADLDAGIQYSRITDYLDTYPGAYPTTDTSTFGGALVYDYAKGIRLLIHKLRTAYPKAKIVICTLNYFRRLSSTNNFTNNGYDNWMKYNDTIRKVAYNEGLDIIDFAKDGLIWSNAYDGYYTDAWTHPTTKGHAVMGARALLDMKNINAI